MRIMTIITALLVWLAVGAAIAADCPNSVTCPCGSTGDNVTICVPSAAHVDACAKLSKCEACEERFTFCTKCPEDSACSPEVRKSRNKRQRRPFNFRLGLDLVQPDTKVTKSRKKRGRPFSFASLLGPPSYTSLGKKKSNCRDPGFIENGFRLDMSGSESPKKDVFEEGESVVYTCTSPEEFVLQGSMLLTCREDGDWSSPRPVCIRYTGPRNCVHPEKPKNGRIRCLPNGEQVTCTGWCLLGYRFESFDYQYVMVLNCSNATGWTPLTSFPDCALSPEKRTCRDPGFIENGFRRNTDGTDSLKEWNFEVGQTVIYGCKSEEFTLQGSPRLTCRQGGGWTSSPPTCIRQTTEPSDSVKFCQDPGVSTDGSRQPKTPPSPRGFLQGSRLEYSCNEGYDLKGEWSIFCLTSGEWSDTRPTCLKVTEDSEADYCENPGIISNGQVVYYPPNGNRRLLTQVDEPEFPEGSRLEYSCNTGHKLLGRTPLICEKPGFWSEDPPFCRRDPRRHRYCMFPGNVVNGLVEHIPVLNEQRRRPSNRDRDEYPEGSRLRYSCDEGYSPDGPTTLTCKRTGSWSPAVPPTCINADDNDRVYCENPGRVLNGKVWYFAPGVRNGNGVKLDSEMDEYPEGSALEYYCDKGFWLQGSHSLMCDSEGFWSAGRPTCVGDCGRSFVKSSVRIRDGQETMSGEWPWVVSVSLREENSSRFVCGGAVFNTRTVVTAAHCLEEGRTYILRFGKHRFRIEDDDSVVAVRTSSRVIIHHDYSPRTLDSDIGLILFQTPIEYSDRVQPICMPTIETTVRNIMTGRVGFVSGWGDTELELPADSLLFAGLPVLNMRTCTQSYMSQNLTLSMTGNMFCAGYPNGTYSVCSGDSGSPFVFYDNLSKRFTLEGLVSFVVRRRQDAQACGLPGRYAIFTRVFRFVPWMYENIE